MSFNEWKEYIQEGDTVILFLNVSQIYAIKVLSTVVNKKGQDVSNNFQTRYGCLKVSDLIGVKFGSKVNLSKGWAHVLYPTPELWTLTLPHRTQILYTPDISMVVMELDIGPGSVVCEAGTGSGSLSHAFLRAVGPSGKLHTFDFHEYRVQVALDEFNEHGLGERVSVTQRDVCADGFGIKEEADAVFLDLPNPWEALPHAVAAIKTSGGRICSFSPCIEQVSRTCEVLSSLGLRELKTLECLQREFIVKNITLPMISSKKDAEEKCQPDSEVSEQPKKKMKLDDENKEEKSITNFQKPKAGEMKFKTGVTQLKQAGHTGFLTFATVPPGLKRAPITPVPQTS